MKIIKENKKRIISLVLAILILITSIPIPVIAEEIQNGNTSQEDVIQNESQDTTESGSESETQEEGEAETETEIEVDGAEELPEEELQASQENEVSLLNEETQSEEGSFKIALRWGGTSNTALTWNATKSENRVMKLTFYYQNEVTPRAYAPGELVVTIPGIGKLNRDSVVKAMDIAADPYGSSEQKRDWSYKYNAATDTYTFYNNHAIEQGETFNGSFEMLWSFSSRNCINDYEQTLKATLAAGEQKIESQELSLNFTSKRDTFYIKKSAKSLVSGDGLSRYVAEGKTVSDYAWVQYTFRYNVSEYNARALKNRYMIDTLPAGCVVAQTSNVTKNEDGTITYKVTESSVPENSVRESSIIVGYPEEYIGQIIDNTVYLNGTYKDEEEETELAQSTVQVELKRIQNQVVGIVPGKSMSPDYVYREALGSDISFSASLRATATTNAEDEGYTVAVTDDLLEIYTPANTEAGTEAQYHTLTDDEYKFTSVTVPGTSSFTNANGYTLTEGDYTVKIYALYKKDVNTRGLDEYTLIHEGKWENSSITKTLEEDAVAIRAEVSGLKESVKSFYISTSGKINVSENVANAVYDNPSYIINYQFTELKDKDGNSLIGDIKEENYSQTRLYERDSAIYGKGVLRASDTISIREYIPPQPTPGYYYAYSNIAPFSVDDNVQYFETNLKHYTSVYNKDKEEIKKVEVHGVVAKEELETLVDTLQLTYGGLKFKNELPSDTTVTDYLMERASLSKNGAEISLVFDFSDNPIVSTSFNLGFTIDARLEYEEYYNSTNPSYTVRTYAYLEDVNLNPQSTASYNGKTMATGSDSESILLALASHQQLIKMVKTQYLDDFVQENAVSPMNTEYTYRLKLRNGYNTLINTEIVDILEHSELTVVDGENPYSESEWYGTFKNVNVTQIENQGLGTKVYYANTLTPTADSWTLMESYQDGIWTTANEVKAIKVEIEGEIAENSIVYADVNMLAPNDASLEDKKAYNSYLISSDAIDLYTGMQSSYMRNMPSNNVDVRLVQKEYDINISKKDAVNGNNLAGATFGVYDSEGNKIKTGTTGLFGTATISGLKEGTYIIKEDFVPLGYEKMLDKTLVIQDGKYSLKEEYTELQDVQYDLTFGTSTSNTGWTQREDGTYESNNKGVSFSTATMTSNEFTILESGTVDFSWAVSSESASWDYVYYTITPVGSSTPVSGTGSSAKIGGNYSITEYNSLTFSNTTKSLSPGTYKIAFTYRKDGSVDKGLDQGFVKNVKVNTKQIVQKSKEIASGEATLQGQIPTIDLSIENQRATGSITVHKIDEYLNSNKKEIPLSGAQFELLDVDGNSIGTKTTNSSGNAVFEGLAWGKTYVIKEKSSPTGYEVVVGDVNTYLSKLNKDKTVTIKNPRKTGTATLTKLDEVDGSKVDGAIYGLYANDNIYNEKGEVIYTKDAVIDSKQTDENGTVTFENLIWGNYYFKEIRTSYGYELSETKHEFTLNASNIDTVVQKTENEVRSKGNFQIIKTDDEENLLDGVEFKFYKADGTEIIVEDKETSNPIPYVTNEYGRLRIENLEWGDYYIQEYIPYEGYENLDTKFYFTINRDTFKNGNTTVFKVINGDTNEEINEIINHKKKGTVTLTKYACDANGDKTETILPGAVYELYTGAGELQGEYTTNEEGKIQVDNLTWGAYYFQEKSAPDGYSVSDKKISFVVNSKTVNFVQELTAYNKLESGEIKINKTIKASSIYSSHGNSTFIFKIVGKDESGTEKVTLYKTMTFTEQDLAKVDAEGNVTKSITISEIEPYKYEITEEETYRYELSEIIPVTHAETDGETGIINLLEVTEKTGEITFKNEKTNNSLLTDTSLKVNATQSEYYLVGISAKTKEEKYETKTEITKDDFEYTLLYSGGQEQVVEITGDVTIDGLDSYTQKTGGTYIVDLQIEYQGRTFDVETLVEFFSARRVLANEVEVGDYVNYDANSGLTEPITYTPDSTLTGHTTTTTYKSNTSMKWRVLSVDREAGTVELIAASNLSYLYLKGQTGYMNAEDILNDIGDVYGHGKGATGGRSVNIEDIEKYSNFDPTTYKNSYSSNGTVGGTKTYTSGTFIKVEGITGGTDDENDSRLVIASSSNPVTVTQTYYGYSSLSQYFENQNAYKTLLVGRGRFWLASRCVGLDSRYCSFLVGSANNSGVDADNLFYSNGYSDNYGSFAVVPVVSLESNILTSGKDASRVWQLKVE